ncbi:hypothetical protein GIB67_004414 [Kingdonia uniflora]|uniref:Uncharacterized protein n=1 Tax=Kingdonia uniflora TaxID=39325 RepID=A0A7J7MRG6_9MAGN|nr:hypothetical protein GIB67_004414 [Kingdonia uniflora]
MEQMRYAGRPPPPPPPPPPSSNPQQPLGPPQSAQQSFFPPLNHYNHYQQQNTNWPPPLSSYPPPQPQPYPAHPNPPYYHQQPYSNPPPPPPNQPYYNQQWGTQNWSHQPGWEHQARNIVPNNEEDWGARAKAWASASASIETQHPQSQFASIGRHEEHTHAYHDPHYTDSHQESQFLSGHQQVPAQESMSMSPSSGPYVSDARISSANHALPQGNNISTIYQQEVPSSYSSFPGKEESGDRNEQPRGPSFLPTLAQGGQQYVQPAPPFPDRSVSMEQSHFTYGDQPKVITDPSNQPLEFVQRFNHGQDPPPQVSYASPDAAGPVGSVNILGTIPGSAYPPIPPVPSGMQFDHSFIAPLIPGHTVPTYGHGPNFQPTVPTGSAPFSLAGTSLHPRPFPGDTNAVSNFSDRPKKASVPNWLREEIIKKTVFTASSQEHPDEDLSKPMYENGIDKLFTEEGQEISKDLDSSKSSEHEEDDEDEIEATKTAAVNKELKRLLTQILLKVTDQLFDEIADKVVGEDDLTVKVSKNIALPNHEASSSLPARSTPTGSATVLIPAKIKETEVDGSSSSLHAGLLGLVSYASDNDEDNDDEEIRSSSVSTSKNTNGDNQDFSAKLSGDTPSDNGDVHNHSSVENGSNDKRVNTKSNHENENSSSSHGRLFGTNGGEVTGPVMSKDSVGGNTFNKPDLTHRDVRAKKSMADEIQGSEFRRKLDRVDENESKSKSMVDEIQGRETRRKADRVDGNESKKSSSSNVFVKEHETGKIKTDEKSGTRERMKDRDAKPREIIKESDSRKSPNSKDTRRETEKVKKVSDKEDNTKKRNGVRDEKGRSRHEVGKDSSRHNRHHSSSRDRRNKDNSRPLNHSSDEASDDSKKRKHRSRNRSLSPSPSRSKRSLTVGSLGESAATQSCKLLPHAFSAGAAKFNRMSTGDDLKFNASRAPLNCLDFIDS